MVRAILCVMVASCCVLTFAMMRAEATTIRMHNNCGSTVCLKRYGPNIGGACSEQGDGGIWSQGADGTWSAVTMWAITNTGCGGQACNTGPPLGVTQFEITVAGTGGNDYYDVSVIGGYNVAIRGVPTNGNCPIVQCPSPDIGSCFSLGGPDQTHACPTGSTDYDVYIC